MTGKRLFWGSVSSTKTGKGSVNIATRKLLQEEKTFFPEQSVVQNPYNVIQRLLNTIKLKKLLTKRRVQMDFMYLLGQVMVLGYETKHHFETLL